MEPQQSSGGFNPQQYDFITNPAQRPKKPLLPNVGSGKNGLLIKLAVGLGGLTLLVLVFALIFSSGSSSKEQLLKVAKQQTEIIRIAEFGIEKGNADTKSLAYSAKLALITDRNAIVASLAKNNVKVKDKELIGSPDSLIDQRLATAEQNGTYDQVFAVVLKELLDAYQTEVKLVISEVESPTGKDALAVTFENAVLIGKQAETK